MEKVDNIQVELQDMGSILAGLPRTMPYSVPKGYFEEFQQSVADATVMAGTVINWPKQQPYSVPDGYFQQLPGFIAARVAKERAVGTTEMPYSVPKGYFETLPSKVLTAARKGRVIALPRFNVLKTVKWAAAAILVLAVGIGSYSILSPHTASPEKILSSVPGNELQDYFQHTYRMDADRIVNNSTVTDIPVDNKEIIQYLNENGWD